MATVVAAAPSPYWYLTRGAGAVALLLLTGSVVLGVVDLSRWRSERWPRVVIDGLHRNVSLLALAILVVHILTSVADSFAPIGLKDAIIPFASPYRPLWIGLGALAFDVLVAVALTSVLRRRLGYRAWRAVHWSAYGCWPLAILHSFGSGTDAAQPWLLALSLVCIAAVGVAIGWRITIGWPMRSGLRVAAASTLAVSPVLLLAWLVGGPLAANWAQRAGTPNALLAAVRPAVATASPAASLHFPLAARLTGTVHQSATSVGLVEVSLRMKMGGGAKGTLDVRLLGEPLEGGGVTMTQSAVALGPPVQPSLFGGRVVALQGSRLEALVSNAAGQSVRLAIDLSIDPATQAVTGSVHSQGSPAGGR
jgi:Ferric reductase like transmembrane component